MLKSVLCCDFFLSFTSTSFSRLLQQLFRCLSILESWSFSTSLARTSKLIVVDLVSFTFWFLLKWGISQVGRGSSPRPWEDFEFISIVEPWFYPFPTKIENPNLPPIYIFSSTFWKGEGKVFGILIFLGREQGKFMEIPSSRSPKFFHIWDFWAKRRKRGAVLTKRFFLKAPTERITENWKGKYHKSISNFDFLVGSDSSCFLGFSLNSWSCSGKIHPSFSSLSRSPPGKGLKWGGIWEILSKVLSCCLVSLFID